LGNRDSDIPFTYLDEAVAFDISSPTWLRWRRRPREHFATASPKAHIWESWNARYAGNPALTAKIGGGYLSGNLTLNGVVYPLYAHRVIWTLLNGRWPADEIDHGNGDRSDNTPFNLRAATRTENGQNLGLRSNNTSGFAGVCWSQRDGKWRAHITIDGLTRYLGSFNTAKAASAAYVAAKAKHHPFSLRHLETA
jgi:hypothetical protein